MAAADDLAEWMTDQVLSTLTPDARGMYTKEAIQRRLAELQNDPAHMEEVERRLEIASRPRPVFVLSVELKKKKKPGTTRKARGRVASKQ